MNDRSDIEQRVIIGCTYRLLAQGVVAKRFGEKRQGFHSPSIRINTQMRNLCWLRQLMGLWITDHVNRNYDLIYWSQIRHKEALARNEEQGEGKKLSLYGWRIIINFLSRKWVQWDRRWGACFSLCLNRAIRQQPDLRTWIRIRFLSCWEAVCKGFQGMRYESEKDTRETMCRSGRGEK